MLIDSHRLTALDRETWDRQEGLDIIHAVTPGFSRKIDRAHAAIHAFFQEDPSGYCGVSWGKDSVVVAGMLQEVRPQTPLVWSRVRPIENPDCIAVRDAFLRKYPHAPYEEIDVWCRHDHAGWHATGTLEKGLNIAIEKYGDRHVSGVRGDESATRNLRMARHGENSARTSAPIGRWTGDDVFAYLWVKELPVHPAYAMSHGGLQDRARIRVASLGGKRGTGWGRTEWETTYYQSEMLALEQGLIPDVWIANDPV